MRSNIQHLTDEEVRAMWRKASPVEALRPVAMAWTAVLAGVVALLAFLVVLAGMGVL